MLNKVKYALKPNEIHSHSLKAYTNNVCMPKLILSLKVLVPVAFLKETEIMNN